MRRLRLSASPDHPRIHLQHARVHSPRGPAGPFFRRLLEELRGARLTGLEPVARDRILRLAFRAEDRPERALVHELCGRHSNLVLVDRQDLVLDVLVPAPARRASPRLREGEPWRAPPGAPASVSSSPPLAEHLPDPGPPPRGAPASAPLSWRVEAALGGEAERTRAGQLRRRLLDRVRRKLKRARNLEKGLLRRQESASGAERLRLDGELLKTHMHRLGRGMAEIELEDHYAGEGEPRTRRIELDPRRSPSQNVEALFARYHKLLRAQGSLERELELARDRRTALEALQERAGEPEGDPEALDREAVEAGLLDPLQEADPRKRPAPAPRVPWLRFSGSRGSEIRVGRNSRDNDALTFRAARGNDLWLHTADVPGSHVVLRLGRGAEPDPEEVLDAAHLAVHFSPLRGAQRAGVWVCRRKQVRKPKGAPPGLVELSGGRRLDLRVQPERLGRLLDPDRARRPGEPPEGA